LQNCMSINHQYWEDYEPFYGTYTADSYLIAYFLVRPGEESVVDSEICTNYYRNQSYSKCVCPPFSSLRSFIFFIQEKETNLHLE
jgi:hypothetical protein